MADAEESQTRPGPEDQERFPTESQQAPGRYRGPSGERRQHSKDRMDSSRDECGVQNSNADGSTPTQDYANPQNRQRERHQHEYSGGGNWPRYSNDYYQQNFDNRRGARGRGQYQNIQYDQRGQNVYNRGRGNQFYGRGAPTGNYNQQGGWRSQTMQPGSYQGQQYSSGSAEGYRGRRQRDDDDDVFISKTLSYILRHGAERQGFQLMKGGFLYVEEILKRTEKLHGVKVEDIERIVKNNDKQRFALEKDDNGKLKIRANQGHTIEVEDLQLEEITSADQITDVIHGTYNSSWGIIKKSGLSRMGRNHVHFAAGEPGESGVISGMRKTCDVLIYIDIKKALEDGLKFYRSANNVILCPGDETGIIYPCYFSGAVTRHPRQKLEFDNTINKDTVKHEPEANAGKYSGKKKERQVNTPVGLSVEDDSKKKKKKKRKNKDKEGDGEQLEPTGEMVEENSKPVAERQATEEEGALESKDGDTDGEALGSMFDENCHQEGSGIKSEEDNKENFTYNREKASDNDTVDACDKQNGEAEKRDSQTELSEENAKYDDKNVAERREPSPSSASNESGAIASVADSSELTVISDIESSISVVETLLMKKPEIIAVCCYGDNLGKEESKINVLSLVTDDCAYVYDIKDGKENLIRDGHVKELFDDAEITKVFNNIRPQSISLLKEWDILLDSTPVWDLTLVYGNLSDSDKKMIDKENLNPTDWDDRTPTAMMKDAGLDKDAQQKLLQRGRAMLKLYSCFHKDQMKTVKRDIYEAVKPTEGSDLEKKFQKLKEQRKQEKERKKKEEKNQKQKQPVQKKSAKKRK